MSGKDYFCCVVDFEDYMETYMEAIIPTYMDKGAWATLMLHNVARMGFFSSDRSIATYCEKIWNIKPIKVGLNMDEVSDE